MRMLIGTSLGGCLQSIMQGEVSEEEVLLVITRTMSISHDALMKIVEMYHADGNFAASHPGRYEIGDFPLDKVKELATRLYENGKIHQPRNFGVRGVYIHPGLANTPGVWTEVNPMNSNSNPAVLDAYDKYRMLDALTK